MDREITALKERERDASKLEAELEEILARHGFGVPAAADPVVLHGPGPAKAAGPQGKTAALVSWKSVKDIDFTYPFVFNKRFTVPANKTLTAWTTVTVSEPVDPVLVAFYRNGGAAGATAFTTRIVANNDDRGDGTRNSLIKWTNNTGTSQIVEVMGFAFSAATRGRANILVIDPVTNITKGYGGYPLHATAVRNHTDPGPPYQDCTGPHASRIKLVHRYGGGFESGVLAVNMVTKKGGYIREDSDVPTQTLLLEDVLPSGGSWNYLLPFMLDVDEPGYEPSGFTGVQEDRYSCSL